MGRVSACIATRARNGDISILGNIKQSSSSSVVLSTHISCEAVIDGVRKTREERE